MNNLAAIVWLSRGQQERFLGLVRSYLDSACAESAAVPAALQEVEATLHGLHQRFAGLTAALRQREAGEEDQTAQAFSAAVAELREAADLYEADRAGVIAEITCFAEEMTAEAPASNEDLHTARHAFDPIAEALRGLSKQVDLLYKLADRAADAAEAVSAQDRELSYDRRAAGRALRQLDEDRRAAVERLQRAVYFHRQAAWLHDRFPDAALCGVPGLVKLVDRAEIAAADWSLTPGRSVGVAPQEADEGFDFEARLREIHAELAGLDQEAAELAARIQEQFEVLLG